MSLPPSDPADNEHPYFVDYVRRYLESKYGQAVYAGGLEIRTTLDPRLQELADRTVDEALEGTQSPIEMALVSLDPRTGFVLAMVGGREFSAEAGQVNLALGNCAFPPPEVRDKVDVAASCWNPESVVVEGGGTGRQPGSSWKSMVLATALEQGVSDRKVYRAPSVYRIPGSHREGRLSGQQLRRLGSGAGHATQSDRALLQHRLRPGHQRGRCSRGGGDGQAAGRQLGVGGQPGDPRDQLCARRPRGLPLDMASAYGVFATNGLRQPASPVAWVKNAQGEFLEDNRQRQPERVLDERVAYNVTDILKGVISRGTGTRADIGRPAAGKTGTAQEWRDAWFVGYTPELSTSVWIGDKTKPTSLFDIKGVRRVTGGSIPAETWNAFMSEALADVAPSDFNEPPPPAPPPRPPRASPPPPGITIAPQTTPTTRSITTTTLPPTTTTTRRTFQLPSNETTTTTQPIVPRNRRADRERTTIRTRQTTTSLSSSARQNTIPARNP